MKQKNIKSNLEDIYKETINKIDLKFGEGTLQFLGEQNKIFDENNIIKSGSYFIDKALGKHRQFWIIETKNALYPKNYFHV